MRRASGYQERVASILVRVQNGDAGLRWKCLEGLAVELELIL
jgi:hypothetical protein